MKKILSMILVCILTVGCVFALASCGAPNKDPKAAKAALEEADYKVTLLEGMLLEGAAAAIGVEDLDAMLTAFKDDDAISIYYFEEKEDAEEAYEKLEELYNEAKEEADEDDPEIKLGKSGNMIWMGTKNAIKAAK